MLSDKFTTLFTIKRQEWTIETVGENEIDKSAEEVTGTFMGYLQQSGSQQDSGIQYAVTLGLTMTKAHKIWCPIDTDVKDGDILESDLGTFSVKGKKINRDGDNPHIKLVVELFGPETEEGSS